MQCLLRTRESEGVKLWCWKLSLPSFNRASQWEGSGGVLGPLHLWGSSASQAGLGPSIPGVPGHLCLEHPYALMTPLQSVFYVETSECVIGRVEYWHFKEQ